MKSIIDYLNDCKEKTGSDYRSAMEMGIERMTISSIRKRGQMSDETAIKIADLLGIKQSDVLIAAAIARSTGEVKTAWESISRMSGIASLVLVSSMILSDVQESKKQDQGSDKQSIIYIMRSC